ncbi:hypothetical protein HID58_066882, partial [Brassica napus]
LSIRNRLTMSKRSASSTPAMTNRAGSKRRINSPVSRSDSSPDPGTGSEHELAAPLPYAYASPLPIGPASFVSEDDLVGLGDTRAGTHPVLPEGDIPLFEHASFPLIVVKYLAYLVTAQNIIAASGGTCLGILAIILLRPIKRSGQGDVCEEGLRDQGSIRRRLDDYWQSPKKSRGGRMATRSSKRSAEVAHSVGSLATALSNLNLQVFPQDGTILPSGEPLEVVQTISQLLHFREWLSIESSLVSQEELDDLKHQVSDEKAQRVAREMEIRDLKDKLKDVEREAEMSSADALNIGKKNQELEEAIETLRLEGDGRKWGKSHRSVGIDEREAQNKGALVPSFEDELAIPHVIGMDIDLRHLHLLTACLSFVFGIFSFVDDKRIASGVFNNLSKVYRLLSDLGAFKLDSRVVIEEWLS